MIAHVLSKISGNVSEAAELIRKAATFRSSCPELAAWFADMASAHMGFNSAGRKLLSRQLDALGADPVAEGKREAFTCWLHTIEAEAASVQAQLDAFSR